MDARLRRRLGDADDGGHLVERQVHVVTKVQGEALIRVECVERLLQVGALHRLVLGPARRLAARLGQLDHRPPAAAPHAAALVGDDGEEPGADHRRHPSTDAGYARP